MCDKSEGFREFHCLDQYLLLQSSYFYTSGMKRGRDKGRKSGREGGRERRREGGRERREVRERRGEKGQTTPTLVVIL